MNAVLINTMYKEHAFVCVKGGLPLVKHMPSRIRIFLSSVPRLNMKNLDIVAHSHTPCPGPAAQSV